MKHKSLRSSLWERFETARRDTFIFFYSVSIIHYFGHYALKRCDRKHVRPGKPISPAPPMQVTGVCLLSFYWAQCAHIDTTISYHKVRLNSTYIFTNFRFFFSNAPCLSYGTVHAFIRTAVFFEGHLTIPQICAKFTATKAVMKTSGR